MGGGETEDHSALIRHLSRRWRRERGLPTILPR
jgi:hypothetical protein